MANLPVIYEISEGIGFLTLNNPEKRNPLSMEVLELLKRYLEQIGQDAKVKVVVLRSSGPVFSCGHDLNELVGGDEESYAGIFAACTRVMEAIRLLPQPVIAQVQGLATAAGCGRGDGVFRYAGGADRPVLHHPRGGGLPGGDA